MNKQIALGIFLGVGIFSTFIASAAENADNLSTRELTQATSQAELFLQPNIVAAVSINYPKIVSQKENQLKLSFEILNELGVQPGVRYGVRLEEQAMPDGKNPTIMQEVYPEKLTFTEGQTIAKAITYTAPGYLSGKYKVWIISDSDKGLPLASAAAGTITLTGNNNYVEIKKETCFLQVEGEAENIRYTPEQGVDINPQENLVANCTVKNNFDTPITLTPTLETHYRTVYGDPVATKTQPNITFNAQEEKTIRLAIPKTEKPQAYDVELTLLQDKTPVSNNMIFHYVLRGESATLQNIRLDKSFYQPGETAQAAFSWTGSVDNFVASRFASTANDGLILELSLTDDRGTVCAPAMRKAIQELPPLNSNVVPFTIEVACFNPTVAAVIKNQNGKVLDGETFSIQSSKQPDAIPNQPKVPQRSKNGRIWIIALLCGALLTIILGVIGFVLKNKNNGNGKRYLTLFLIATGFALGGQADAITLSAPNNYSGADYELTTSGVYEVSATRENGESLTMVNPRTLMPGERLTLHARVTSEAGCSNVNWIIAGLRFAFNPSPKTNSNNPYVGKLMYDYWWDPRSTRSDTFTQELKTVYGTEPICSRYQPCEYTGPVETAPGAYQLLFRGYGLRDWAKKGGNIGAFGQPASRPFTNGMGDGCDSGCAWADVVFPYIVQPQSCSCVGADFCGKPVSSNTCSSQVCGTDGHYYTCTASGYQYAGGNCSQVCPVCTPGQWDPVNCRRCSGVGQWSGNCSDYGGPSDPGWNATAWCTCDWTKCNTRSNPGCVGSCGPAAKVYAATDAVFSGGLCTNGSAMPANPLFPLPGGMSNWTCSHLVAPNAACSASRAALSVAPTVMLSLVSPSHQQITIGGSVGLRWTIGNADWCWAWTENTNNERCQWNSQCSQPIDPITSSNSYGNGSGTRYLTNITPPGQHSYYLKCGNAGGETLKQVNVRVNPAAQPGICGTADGKEYPIDAGFPNPHLLCSQGSYTPNPLSLPNTPGESVTWHCSGLNGGPSSGLCKATRAAAPPPASATPSDWQEVNP